MSRTSVTPRIVAAIVLLALTACQLPDPWDVDEARRELESYPPGQAGWCDYLEGVPRTGPEIDKIGRKDALARADIDPFGHTLACEYLAMAEDERAEHDWTSAQDFIETAKDKDKVADEKAKAIAAAKTPEAKAKAGVYGSIDPPEVPPSDLSVFPTRAERRCSAVDESPVSSPRPSELAFAHSDLANFMMRKGVRARVPDLLALAQSAYECWLQEEEEGHQCDDIAACRKRFEWAKAQIKNLGELKGNLVFLLPDKDDSGHVGAVSVEDQSGSKLELDRLDQAAQLEGDAGEAVTFDAEADIGENDRLKNVKSRSDSLPDAVEFKILYDLGAERWTDESEAAGVAELRADLGARDSEDVLGIKIEGHADCYGNAAFNKRLSKKRADLVLSEIIDPIMNDRQMKKFVSVQEPRGLGEALSTDPDRDTGSLGCPPNAPDRRVIVTLQ